MNLSTLLDTVFLYFEEDGEYNFFLDFVNALMGLSDGEDNPFSSANPDTIERIVRGTGDINIKKLRKVHEARDENYFCEKVRSWDSNIINLEFPIVSCYYKQNSMSVVV